jgi:hypothetical protein
LDETQVEGDAARLVPLLQYFAPSHPPSWC